MGIGKLKKSNKASIQSFRSRKEVEWKAFKNGDDIFLLTNINKIRNFLLVFAATPQRLLN